MTLALALEYAAHGFRVCPLRTGKKQYSRRSARAHTRATTDPDQLRKWWRGHGASDGVAVRVPLGVAIVDIDKEGIDAAHELGIFDKQTHCTPSPDAGYRLIFDACEVGRGLKELAGLPKGIEVFFESSSRAIRMYEGETFHPWKFAPLPDAIAAEAQRMSDARAAHRSISVAASIITTATPDTQRCYAYATLTNNCADLGNAGKGERHAAALKHGRLIGSVLHMGLSSDDAMRHAKSVIDTWPRDGRAEHWRTFCDALEYGSKTPMQPQWNAPSTRATFERANALAVEMLARLPASGWAHMSDGTRCKRATVRRVVAGIIEHAKRISVYGVFFASQRDIMKAGGITSRATVERGIDAAIAAGVLVPVDRETVAWLAKFARVDARTQANAYALNVSELAMCARKGPESAEEWEGIGAPGNAPAPITTQNGQERRAGHAQASPHSSISGPFRAQLQRMSRAGARPSVIEVLRQLGEGLADNVADFVSNGAGERRTVYKALAELRAQGAIGFQDDKGRHYVIDPAALEIMLSRLEGERMEINERLGKRIESERASYYAARAQKAGSACEANTDTDGVALRVTGALGVVEVMQRGAELLEPDALERVYSHAIASVGAAVAVETAPEAALFGVGVKVGAVALTENGG